MDFGQYLAQTFPGVRITGNKRDPNSALGRANPRSHHIAGNAWDIAPIEGQTFDQFRDRLQRDGWNVVEAIDEVSNPSKHATGPHWHTAVKGRKEPVSLANMITAPQQPMPQAMGLSDLIQNPQDIGVMQAQPLDVQPQKLGTWDQGGRGWNTLGIIGDALQTAGGGQATYMPYVQEQKAQQQQLALRDEERRQSIKDWVAKEIFKQQNPGPSSMETDLAAWNRMTPEQQAQFAQMQDIKNPIAVAGPTGTYRVARTVGQPQGPKQGEVVDGFQYVGGDPANPNSWRSAQ